MKFVLKVLLSATILSTMICNVYCVKSYLHREKAQRNSNRTFGSHVQRYLNKRLDRMIKYMDGETKKSLRKKEKSNRRKKHTKKRKLYKSRHLRIKHLKHYGNKSSSKRRKLMGGGSTNTVVVAPNQGSGIANSQIVVNSLGSPAATPFTGEEAIPAYNNSDADPKLIVTRMRMPGNTLI